MTLEVHIPEALAAAAQKAAASLGMSCSELVARAVAAFLQSSKDVVRTERGLPQGAPPVWTEGWEAHRL